MELCLYFRAFFWLYLIRSFFYLPSIVEDVIDRPYIAIGFAGFVLIIPLAITSFKRLQKKLGKHWFTLHKLVYVIGILGVVHYWWLVKVDIFWPMIYAAIVSTLLADRLFVFIKKRQDKKQPFKNATTGSGSQ